MVGSMFDVRELIERRLPVYAEREAVRVSHHEALRGLTIDDYGGWVLLTDYGGHDRNTLTRVAEATLAGLREAGRAAHGAVCKARPDDLSKHARDAGVELLAGEVPPERFAITERGVRYEISFTDAGFGTGLFLDMAEGRRWVREHAQGQEVLNLFSYTGAFSVAAALGGAARVIEVDTGKKWLTWAQRNQQLNGVDVVRQRRNDAVSFLQRQDTASFDLIISDPPSFANPKRGKRFVIEEGYRLMSPHLARVLRGGGWVLACCNHAQTDRRVFRRWLPKALTLVDWIEPPADYPGADYLKVAVLHKPPRD